MKIVRSSRRKGIEELYGAKMEGIHPVKSQAMPQGGSSRSAPQKSGRNPSAGGGGLGLLRPPDSRIQRSFVTDNDYYIQTNLPLTAGNLRNNPSILVHSSQAHLMPATHPQPSPYAMSSRRGNTTGKMTGRQTQGQKVAHFAVPDGKANNSVYNLGKSKEHSHQQRRAVSKSVTQRTNYGTLEGTNNNAATDISDKEMILPNGTSGSINKRRSHQHAAAHHMQMEMPIQMAPMPHPPQHQLHQQQLTHHSHSKQQHQNVPHQHQHPHPHAHQHTCPRQSQSSSQPQVSAADDDDKDDDPEEFFELIRQTVQTAIGNKINDALFKNFRDLGTKIERFSGELKQTNDQLNKLKEAVTSKLVHYGEENSRHFRYLCMKSEYDKMYFQHQAMLGTNPPTDPSTIQSNPSQQNVAAIGSTPFLGGHACPMSNQKFNSKAPKHSSTGKMSTSSTNKVQNPCAYRNTSKALHQQQTPGPHKSSSDQSLGQSSQLKVAEVLGHIQRFCTKMQFNDMGNQMLPDAFANLEASLVAKAKSNAGLGGAENKAAPRSASGSQRDKKTNDENECEMQGDSMDEAYSELEDFPASSEEISSCSDDDCGMTYPRGAVTSRGPAPVNSFRRQPNNGAGDGQ
ncbi:lateral signaling target protein 2 homolog [Drosophila miranda]|uniref:lateral signaling target protein 2 homolog n=1 Tax=Drosophila miranda TaxID=7229 RepID=UPI0007E84E95|nr:lateral signaling target protein 2 homolog [Drosophila miranda]